MARANAWSGSTRGRATASSPWRRLRSQVLERDGQRCTSVDLSGTRCPEQATEVDHTLPCHLGGTDDPSNLASMCKPHHLIKTLAEVNAARPRERRAPEAHPGLIK